MHHQIAALVLCAAAFPVLSGAALAQDASGARDASAKFTAALAGGDAATAAAYFTDNAVALPPGRPQIEGKAQIQQFLGGMTHSVKNLKYTTDTVQPIGDTTAREIGSFSFKLQNNDVDGKYLLIWTKVGSDWKIAADMWNRNGTGRQGGAGGRNGRQGGGGGRTGAPQE